MQPQQCMRGRVATMSCSGASDSACPRWAYSTLEWQQARTSEGGGILHGCGGNRCYPLLVGVLLTAANKPHLCPVLRRVHGGDGDGRGGERRGGMLNKRF